MRYDWNNEEVACKYGYADVYDVNDALISIDNGNLAFACDPDTGVVEYVNTKQVDETATEFVRYSVQHKAPLTVKCRNGLKIQGRFL